MEAIDIRDNFPVLNGGDGVILSKRGDICVGWEVQLPPAFRCNEAGYDSLVGTLAGAIALLPDYTIVHKQDIFMRKRYHAEKSFGFLEKAYEEHFDGREYLDHRCLLWLSFSSKKNVRSGSSGLLGLTGPGLPSAAAIGRCLTAAEQFGAMLGGNSLLSLRRLTEEDVFGADKPGLLQDYLNFTDGGADVLSDIQVSPRALRIGDKSIACHLLADLDQLPGEVASCRRDRDLSTENSVVSLSYLHEVGQALDCEHVVNWYCVKEPLKDIHGSLDSKRRQMQSMSARNAENRKYAEEINEYLETAAVQQMSTVRCHLNVLSAGDSDRVTSAISKLGITPVRDIANAPAQFWTSIPGNESGLAFSEYMTMELKSALCLNIFDGFDTGIADGVLKMSDRIRLVPQRFDIQEKALDAGLIENYNVFLLGPSGSGKSFFMNKYLRSCYVAGQHCFLIDVGDSYRALCHIIKEESGGKDGTYYTFEKGKPISFNPFRNVKRFSQADSEAMNFLFTLMVTLWKNGKVEISSSAEKYVRESISQFLRQWEALRQAQGDSADPVFNDYFEYVRDVFGDLLKAEEAGKEYFDLKDYLISLEQFYKGGPYDYLLNSRESVNILEDRFVVFEIDHIKGDPVIYPITTLVIMDAFMEKMTSNSDFKVMCIEEAWKAIMGTQMATYMLELWKTARKHRTAAMVVTQELKDITSSPIIKDSIVENSGVKILLDQTKYLNRFEELAAQLSLSEDDKGMVLSLNRLKIPGASGREVFFNLGNKKSFVMRLEVSPEERIAFSSAKKDKERLAKAVEKSGGSYIKAIKKLVRKEEI
jgi:conjugation system TraG family ATPase